MSTKSGNPKKVRLACRRCRARRIKCDGQVPACSNCAKAGEICLDVDSQNADQLVPRNFATTARLRIKWLEDIIQERLPDVDLMTGPQVDLPTEVDSDNMVASAEGSSLIRPKEQPVSHRSGTTSQSETLQSRKRGAEDNDSTDNDDALPEGTQSVAVNLGMLSLNSDSLQKHYLGSSSGMLFTNIIGASPTSQTTRSTGSRTLMTSSHDHNNEHSSQNSLQQRYWSLHQLLRQELPKHDDAIILLQTFLREVHPDYPVFHPLSLFSALEALYGCLSSSLENDPLIHGWPQAIGEFYWNGQYIRPNNSANDDVHMPIVAFTFFMIFNVAAIVKVRARVYEFSPERFYRAALLFSGDGFSKTTLSAIQALVALMIHSLLTPAEVNLWTLMHVGMAHCVELGLHRESSYTPHDDVVLKQIKRFVFYVIYSFDRSISTIQGRPLGLRDEAFDVQTPTPDFSNSSIQANSFLGPVFSTNVTHYSKRQFDLDRIVSDIKTNLYHLPIESIQFPRSRDPTEHQDRINTSLQSWWEETKRCIGGLQGLDSYHKQLWTLKMKIRYHSTMILLFQPSQVLRQPKDEALQKCFDSACAILNSYQLQQDWHCLQYGWRAVQNIFAAGATMVYTFWSSKTVQRNASITDLSKVLRSCSSLLSIGGEWWPSVRGGKVSFETVVDLTIRKLYTSAATSKQPRLGLSRQQISGNQTSIHSDLQDQRPSNALHGPNVGGDGHTARAQQYGQYDNNQSLTSDWPSNPELIADGPAFETSRQGLVSYSEPSPDARSSLGIVPEIEDFLADFDNSDFSWNMPLYDFDENDDIGMFLTG